MRLLVRGIPAGIYSQFAPCSVLRRSAVVAILESKYEAAAKREAIARLKKKVEQMNELTDSLTKSMWEAHDQLCELKLPKDALEEVATGLGAMEIKLYDLHRTTNHLREQTYSRRRTTNARKDDSSLCKKVCP